MPSMSAVEWHETLIIGRLSPELGRDVIIIQNTAVLALREYQHPAAVTRIVMRTLTPYTFIAQPPGRQ